MIQQIGIAVFQNNYLNDETTVRGIFPKTETDKDFEIIKNVQTGIRLTELPVVTGYRVSMKAEIKLLFPRDTNTIISSTLFQQLEYLLTILSTLKEFYYMPECVADEFGVYKITEQDVDDNLAYKVSVRDDFDIDNFVKHLEESGQSISVSMKSLNKVDITENIPNYGYGLGTYGSRTYGG